YYSARGIALPLLDSPSENRPTPLAQASPSARDRQEDDLAREALADRRLGLGPAVNRDDRSAGDAIARRGEKGDDFRDVGGRDPEAMVRVRHRRPVRGGVEDRGGDRIDPDLLVGQFLRQRLGQRRDGGFGRGVA